MLYEDESAPGFQYPTDLGQHMPKSLHRAENKGGKNSVDAVIGEGEGLGQTLDKFHRSALLSSGLAVVTEHEGVRLHTHHSQPRRQIAKVRSGPGTNLNKGPHQILEEISLPTFHEGVVFASGPGHEPGHESVV